MNTKHFKVNGVSVLTTGQSAYGVQGRGTALVSVGDNSYIETKGKGASGILSAAGATVNVRDSTIVTRGTSAGALGASADASGAAATLNATNVTIETYGDRASGATAFQSGSTITITDSSIHTRGTSSYGLFSESVATLDADGLNIVTDGTSAFGAYAINDNASKLSSVLNIRNSTITTSGSIGDGLYAEGKGVVNASNVSIHTSGTTAYGLTAILGGQVNFDNGTVITTASDAAGIGGLTTTGQINTFNITRARIDAAGDGFLARGDNNVTLAASVLDAGSGLAMHFKTGKSTFLADSSQLNGAAITETGSVSGVTLQGASSWNMTGASNVTSLVNDTSTIVFATPTGNPALQASYKTLTTGSYTGVDGTISLNTFLGDDASPSDRLVINGGSAAGSTTLLIANTAGGGAMTSGDGILVVDTQNGATTDTGAFTLGNRVAAGAYEYSLFRGGPASTDSWFLRSTTHIVPPGPGPEPGPDSRTGSTTPPTVELPDYRHEVPTDAVVPSLANRFGLAMLGTYHDRNGEDYGVAVPGPTATIWCKDPAQNYRCTITAQQEGVYADGSGGRGMAAWGRVFGETGNVGYRSAGDPGRLNRFDKSGPSYDYGLAGFQAGMDLWRHENEAGTLDIAGLYVGAGRIDSDIQAVYGGKAGSTSMDGYSVGGYWTRKGASGWYIDAVAQATWYDNIEASSVEGQTLKSRGWGFAGSLEGGYPLALGWGMTLEPQAQLIYQHIHIDNGADAFGLIRYDDTNALYGRIGARLTKSFTLEDGREITTWARANLWQSFGPDGKTTFTALDGSNPVGFRTALGGTWGQVGLGVSGKLTRNVSAFASGDYNFALGSGRGTGWSGRLGLKVTW